MKIEHLTISNFRGIQLVEVRDLGETIIIAGQNGSGKSCIFDAIRLLKSTYGGYQHNEWQQFFGEFQIQLHGQATNLKGLFNNPSRSVEIECQFRLRDHEKAYATTNAAELLETTIWQTLLPEAFQYGGFRKALFAAQFRDRQPEVNNRIKIELPQLQKELAAKNTIGKITITPQGQILIANSLLLTVIFSNYRPRDIGVIDFHGAQRHYGRELVQGINLSLDQTNQAQSQHTLYNYSNKYNNVKSEMAGNFIKELLAEKASGGPQVESSLIETLKELFESFFPEKKFLGPRPTKVGGLDFPVVTQGGNEHDLDELSSGEKEILYGYLRIRSSAPRDSIILLDEPELHLNPRLIRGLPEFYRKHLGEALQNQLWLVTHSDALIREAVGKPGFNVFHMLPCGADPTGGSQLRSLSVSADLDVVLADLVGDLAAYRPGGKGLIFEGGGDSDFDKTFAAAVFSDELQGINVLSGSNKIRVKLLHEILERAYTKGDLPTKFYAVTDRDADEGSEKTVGVNRFEWDVYHIENYLLEPALIAAILNSLEMSGKYTEVTVEEQLMVAARAAVPNVLLHKMRAYANSRLVGLIDLRFNPNTLTIAKDLREATERSMQRLNEAMSTALAEEEIESVEKRYREEIEHSFATGTWKKDLPGREILKQFGHAERIPIAYEMLRNLIVGKMVESGHKPAGMKAVIDRIRQD